MLDGDLFGVRFLHQAVAMPQVERMPDLTWLVAPEIAFLWSRLFHVVRDGLEVFAATIAAIKRDRSKQPLRVTTTNAFASRWLVPRLTATSSNEPERVCEDRLASRERSLQDKVSASSATCSWHPNSKPTHLQNHST